MLAQYSSQKDIPLHSEQEELDPRGYSSVGATGSSSDLLAAETAGHLQLLIKLLDTISDRIFLKDTLGRITFVNEAFLSAYDLKSSEILGKQAEDVLPAEIASTCKQIDSSVFERGETVCLETHWKDSDSGTRQWSETHKFPMRDSAGNITGIVGISRDITARRKAEEELKRSESLLLHAARLSSLGELAAGMAHEVNQPLFSILNYAKAIENKLQDGESLDVEAIRKWIRQINREAVRGGEITRRLKSFIKPADAQRKSSATNRVVRSSINRVILDSVDFMAMEARDADASIETELTEGLPDLSIDQIQIQQVLVNLLKNAIEACNEHTAATLLSTAPRILVSSKLSAAGIEVAVADNGPGVSVADDVNILDPFQTTKHEGIGLGLAISNTIIKGHQGQLTYHPNDWSGVTFHFTLPITS